MKVGSIVYATCQGLGYLAKSFYDAGIVTDVFVVEHSRHPTQIEWYPEGSPCWHISRLVENTRYLRQFINDLDVLLCFETPFHWPIVDYARSKGVKTVLMPMYECTPTKLPAQFDEYWCPSLLDLRYFCEMHMPTGERVPPFETCHGIHNAVSRFTPVPVQVEWKQRTEAKVFVHNAGHGGLKGRNGTKELLEAVEFVKSDAQIIVRSQHLLPDVLSNPFLDRVEFRIGEASWDSLFTEGNVFIFPEKFNGLSLPLQEARAAGMLVMATDRYPMNTWLPTRVPIETPYGEEISDCFNPLIPVTTTVKNRVGPPYNEFDEAIINPRRIAEKIDEWYGLDISDYSRSGREWAETMSWEVLGPKYRALLEGLV